MLNYRSAKLEPLALKWAVTEKFNDYLLASKFTDYTDNNPLAYVQTSKLGVLQIDWLSELSMFDFNIIYRLGRTKKTADALSWCPEPNCKLESDSDTGSDDPVMLSYATICDIIKPVLGDTKIPFAVKKEAHGISNSLGGGDWHECAQVPCCTWPYSSGQCSLSFQSGVTSHYDQSTSQSFCTGTGHSIHM